MRYLPGMVKIVALWSVVLAHTNKIRYWTTNFWIWIWIWVWRRMRQTTIFKKRQTVLRHQFWLRQKKYKITEMNLFKLIYIFQKLFLVLKNPRNSIVPWAPSVGFNIFLKYHQWFVAMSNSITPICSTQLWFHLNACTIIETPCRVLKVNTKN